MQYVLSFFVASPRHGYPNLDCVGAAGHGTMEAGEKPRDCARREVLEEVQSLSFPLLFSSNPSSPSPLIQPTGDLVSLVKRCNHSLLTSSRLLYTPLVWISTPYESVRWHSNNHHQGLNRTQCIVYEHHCAQ